MKRLFACIISVAMIFGLTGCGSSGESAGSGESIVKAIEEKVVVKQSDDKHVSYVKNYVGKNAASFGYYSMGGERRDHYGEGSIKLVFAAPSGEPISIEDGDNGTLKEYVVVDQSLAPNTEIRYEFMTGSDGEESSLVTYKSVEEILLSLKKVGESDSSAREITPITASTDKHVWYINEYIGRNLQFCGYTSMGGERRDRYGEGSIKLVINADDGSYIDIGDGESLKDYVVVDQSIPANTELTIEFLKSSEDGQEMSLVESLSIEEIELTVEKINS